MYIFHILTKKLKKLANIGGLCSRGFLIQWYGTSINYGTVLLHSVDCFWNSLEIDYNLGEICILTTR